MKILYGRNITCERVGVGKTSECGENKHIKMWMVQL